MNDGTFGVTGAVEPFDADLVERLETHSFDRVKSLQWRNRDLDFASLDRLRDSLREAPREGRLTRARSADDVTALESVSHDREVAAIADRAAAPSAGCGTSARSPTTARSRQQNHAELVATLYRFLMAPAERIPEDWFAKQVALRRPHRRRHRHACQPHRPHPHLDLRLQPGRLARRSARTGRSARARSRTACRTRCTSALTQRFVDRRTSALMRGLKEKDELDAEIAEDGAVHVEKPVRRPPARLPLSSPTRRPRASTARPRAMLPAHVLAKELDMRVRRVVCGQERCLQAQPQRPVLWREQEIARLEAGEDPAQADRSSFLPTSTSRGRRQGKGAGTRLDDLASRTDRRASQAAGRDRRRQDICRPGPRHRLPSEGELRRAAARGGRRRDPLARSAGAGAAAQVRRPLRRLQYLLSRSC